MEGFSGQQHLASEGEEGKGEPEGTTLKPWGRGCWACREPGASVGASKVGQVEAGEESPRGRRSVLGPRQGPAAHLTGAAGSSHLSGRLSACLPPGGRALLVTGLSG